MAAAWVQALDPISGKYSIYSSMLRTIKQILETKTD